MALLEDKVALVTGAAGGIGRATALLFAREGARVVVNDVGSDPDGNGARPERAQVVVDEIVAAGGEAIASSHDVTDREAVDAMVTQAIESYGRIDVLVNNAGILRDRTLLKMEEEDFDAVIRVNLKGCFLCCRAVAAEMKRNGAGSIINTTSVAGMLGNFGQCNYAAAKAGIYGLTRTASIELQRHGIRVNAVAPLAKTRLTQDLPMFQQVDSMTPEHIAPAHLFLASSLSKETTGIVLAVAGGRLSTYRVVESAGEFKESGDGIWSAPEIAEHFASIRKG